MAGGGGRGGGGGGGGRGGGGGKQRGAGERGLKRYRNLPSYTTHEIGWGRGGEQNGRVLLKSREPAAEFNYY